MNIHLSKALAFLRDRRGTSAVDFAIVGSTFIVLTLGTFEFGRVLFVRSELAHATDAVSRMVLVSSSNYDGSTAAKEDLLEEAEEWLDNLDPQHLSIDVGDEAIDGIDYRTITVSYDMPIFVPGFSEGVRLAHFRRAPKL